MDAPVSEGCVMFSLASELAADVIDADLSQKDGITVLAIALGLFLERTTEGTTIPAIADAVTEISAIAFMGVREGRRRIEQREPSRSRP